MQVDLLEDLCGDDFAVFGNDGGADDDDLVDFLDTVQFSDVTPVRGGIGFIGCLNTGDKTKCIKEEQLQKDR